MRIVATRQLAEVPNTSLDGAAVADVSVVDPERDFAEFVSQHEHTLRGLVEHRLRDSPSDVDDAYQEGLVRIWREFPSFPEDPTQRTAYAGRLLNHASIDLVRHKWGRHGQRRNRFIGFDFTKLDREEGHHPEKTVEELQRVLERMHDELAADTGDSDELERRLTALRQMLPALKPLERAALLASHPSGGNRPAPEVAKRLGVSPGQVRQLCMEAMATLRPLLAHALAPELDDEEAGRVLDYTARTMTDKRQRGRMKRHLKHCEACRALADSQRAVIGTGARLMLPVPGLLGLAQAAVGTGAVSTAALANGGGGAAVAGSGAVSGVVLKVATGVAALTAAAGGVTAIEHRPSAHPVKHTRQAAVQPTATATPEPTIVASPTAAAATPSPEPTQAPAMPAPTAEPTAAPTQEPLSSPSEPPPVTTAPRSTASIADPPAHKTSSKTADSFQQEFGP